MQGSPLGYWFYVQRREELIKIVLENNKSIAYAAKKMGIKYATARFIVKKYASTGAITAKKTFKRNN